MLPQSKAQLQRVRGRCLTASPWQSAKKGHWGPIFSRSMRAERTSLLQKTIVFCRIWPKVGASWQRKNEARRNRAAMRTLVRAGLEMPFAVHNNSLAQPRNIWITLRILLCQYMVLFILIVCLYIHTAIFLLPRPCNKTKCLNKHKEKASSWRKTWKCTKPTKSRGNHCNFIQSSFKSKMCLWN